MAHRLPLAAGTAPLWSPREVDPVDLDANGPVDGDRGPTFAADGAPVLDDGSSMCATNARTDWAPT